MRFTPATVLAVMALAAPVLAQTSDFDAVNVPTPDQTLTIGTTLDIQWETIAKYQDNLVNIQLIGGDAQNAQEVLGTIATNIHNSDGHFTWNVDPIQAGLAFYGFIISKADDASIFQYSNPFHIVDGASQGSTSSAVVSTPTPSAPSSSTTTVTLSSVAGASSCAPSATGGETLIVVDITTTVPCQTAAPTASAPTSAAAPGTPIADDESSSSAAADVPSVVTPAPSASAPAITGVAPPSSFSSAVWVSPSNPPAPTVTGIPTTSGATRVGASIAVLGGLITAFLVL